MKTAALIPAYQPDDKLITLLDEIRTSTDFFPIVVNDGSPAECEAVFAEAGKRAVVLRHEVNRGKGAALRTGLEYILSNTDCDITVTLDADGQHRLADAVRVASVAAENGSALIIGGRRFSGKVPFHNRIGNGITRFVFRLATGISVHDTQTGLRAFGRQLIPQFLKIRGDRYEYEMNMLLECLRADIHVREIPIDTIYIEGNKSSHFRAVRDSLRIYRDILKFSAASFVSFLVDYGLFSLLTLLSENIIFCNIAARAVSSIFNYTLNKNLVFHKKGIVKLAVGYFALVIAILAANTALLTLLTRLCGLNEYFAKLLVECLMFIVSWCVQRLVIFKN